MKQIFSQLFYEVEKGRDTVLVTLIADRGSAPRKAGAQMLVGAGTVLTKEQVDAAAAAGAKFIVSPGFDPEISAKSGNCPQRPENS